jgi:hypothetical protein
MMERAYQVAQGELSEPFLTEFVKDYSGHAVTSVITAYINWDLSSMQVIEHQQVDQNPAIQSFVFDVVGDKAGDLDD